ncbi:MAG: CBS domain-containing protein [Nanoarchaeota archaeon]|nr:CBS domain-containing protein [Nanoarchaeota archaeon]
MKSIQVKNIMTKKILSAQTDDIVLDVAKLMYKNNIGSVIIKAGEIPLGIITERDIAHNCVMGQKNILSTKTDDIMSEPIICIDENATVVHACSFLSEKNIKKLAVTNDDEEIIGVVTMTDIINNVGKLHLKKEKIKVFHIKNVMTKGILYLDYNKDISNVIDLMVRENVGSVVLTVDNVAEGIITERDIVKNFVVGKKNFMKMKAKDVMSKPLIKTNENSTIIGAAHIMKKKNIKKLIVGKENKITGIMTQTDIIHNIKNLV